MLRRSPLVLFNARDVLGLTGLAVVGPKEVKKAYLKLAKRYHPDTETGDIAKFRDVKEAYERLKSMKQRNTVSKGSLMDELKKWYKERPPTNMRKGTKTTAPRSRARRGYGQGTENCGLCGKLIAIPVRMVKTSNCSCNPAYCMTCVRDSLGLNGVLVQHRSPKLSPCPSCHATVTYPPTERAYVIDTHLSNYLDKKFGPINCHRCPDWTGPRSGFLEHIKKCGKCPKCGTPVRAVNMPYHKCGQPLKICRK
eukprot:TRINITY_DN1281_c2_g3_i1.p1 TRINITY_DN1281_c2_g3~~TRINITY_DN1281_c2_g3_i1.p1  ORF type:complete len:252 (+),score=32.94 TRINITY_DN1281_c2_g3_i1:221-976(+)